jgi:hypothetical protein
MLLLRLRVFGLFVLGPVVVAVFAGVELGRYGAVIAAAAACLVFILARGAVGRWSRLRVRRARRRIASLGIR